MSHMPEFAPLLISLNTHPLIWCIYVSIICHNMCMLPDPIHPTPHHPPKKKTKIGFSQIMSNIADTDK